MIKGCQKKIIYLKNTESGLFDEAYFVVSRAEGAARVKETDMINEAKKIIEGASEKEYETEKKKSKNMWFFSLGCVCATAFFCVIGLALSFL
jgi:hypothetical protein